MRGLAFDGFAGFFPADDSGREVFDVAVSELAGEVGCFAVGPAIFVAAVGDDERGFVFWEEFGDFRFACDEIDGAGDVAGSERIGAIYVDERDFAFRNGALEFVQGNVWILFRSESGGNGEEGEPCENLASVHMGAMLIEARR